MADILIREVDCVSEFDTIYPVLKELRSTPSIETVKLVIEEATKRDDFKLVGAFDENQCLGVMAYRVLFDFTHGKHLYVDDLVVTESARGRGVGTGLIHFAENQARALKCTMLRLCTGLDNLKAQKFYDKLGWQAKSYAYKKYL